MNHIAQPIAIGVIILFVFGLTRLLAQWMAAHGKKHIPFLVKERPALLPLKEEKPGWREYGFVCLAILLYACLMYFLAYLNRGGMEEGVFGSLRTIWKQWDTSNYMAIAENGYVTEGNDKVFIVFYPLYPLLMRGVMLLGVSSFAAGILVSLASLCVAGCLLYALVMREFSRKEAVWSLIFLLCNPGAFFFVSVFTESLFLALTLACFYMLRNKRFVWASIFGLLAAFTRNLGVLMVVPFFMEWVDTKAENKKEKLLRLLPVLFIPLGTVFYLLINNAVYGNYFHFLEVQKNHWGQQFMFFAENIGDIGQRIFTYDRPYNVVLWLPQFIVIVGVLVLFMLSVSHKLRPSYIAYMAAYIFTAVGASWLLSGVRYMIVLFPVAIILARMTKRDPFEGGICAFIMFICQIILMCLHTTGQHVM